MTTFPKVRIEKNYTGKTDWWEVVEDCRVHHPVQDYTINAGYRTDFLSVPAIFTPIIQPHSSGANEAILHDYEHDHRLFSTELGAEHARQLSNFMMAARMCQTKAPIWKIWLILMYTTCFSWVRWYDKKKRINL